MTVLSRRYGLLVVTAFIFLTGSALAVVVTQNATETLNGVSSTGSPSTTNGGTGTGKIYKDTNTGILYEAVSGIVINQSTKQKTTFNNLGVSVTDPGSSQTFTATYDQEVIYLGQPGTGFALAGRLAVFYPPAN